MGKLYLGRQKWFLVKKISIWDSRIGFSPNRFQKYFESVLRFVFRVISAYVKWLFIEQACLVFCRGRSYNLVVNKEVHPCTGRTAHRGSRGIALPFRDHGTKRG